MNGVSSGPVKEVYENKYKKLKNKKNQESFIKVL